MKKKITIIFIALTIFATVAFVILVERQNFENKKVLDKIEYQIEQVEKQNLFCLEAIKKNKKVFNEIEQNIKQVNKDNRDMWSVIFDLEDLIKPE